MAASIPPTVQSKDTPALGPAHPLYSDITIAPLSPTTSLPTIVGQAADAPDGTVPHKALGEQIDLSLS